MDGVSRKPSTSAVTASATCASCGAELAGPWCAECGQKVLRERHTLRRFVLTGLGQVLDLDRGLLHTVMQLTAAPGRTICDYLAGATARYTHPAGYVLIGFAAFAITGRLAGGEAGLADGGNRVFTATAIPFVAAAARLIFWRTRLNYAEHLIAIIYLLSHVLLALSAVQALVPIVPLQVGMFLGFVGIVAGLGYFCWAYGQVIGGRPWLGAAGGLAALAVGLAVWALVLTQVVAVARTSGSFGG